LQKVPTFGEEFGRAIGMGAGEGLNSAIGTRKKMAELIKENKDIYEATGILLKTSDPDMRKVELQEGLKNKYKQGQEESKFDRRMELINQAKKGQNPSFKEQITPQSDRMGQQANQNIMQQSNEGNMPQQRIEQDLEDPYDLAERYA